MQSEVTLNLYEEEVYYFTQPVLHVPIAVACELKYRLLDAATGDTLDPLIFDFDFAGV